MPQTRSEFIKVDNIPEGYEQTKPVEPSARLPNSEIRIELCNENDARKVAKGLYDTFPAAFWTKREPEELRPSLETRISRMTQRLTPTFSLTYIKWIKAIHTPTNSIMGVACWTLPGAPVHNPLLRSAVRFYHIDEKMSWTPEQIEEMWSHVSHEHWDVEFGKRDDDRRDFFQGEAHWWLSPLMVWPEWQGKGVGKKLLDWAIDQADSKRLPEPMYLESAITARAVYLHVGFVPVGEVAMVRRGPRVEEGRAEGKGKGK